MQKGRKTERQKGRKIERDRRNDIVLHASKKK